MFDELRPRPDVRVVLFHFEPVFQSVRLSCETRTLDRGQHDVDAVAATAARCSQYDLLASRRVTLQLSTHIYT